MLYVTHTDIERLSRSRRKCLEPCLPVGFVVIRRLQRRVGPSRRTASTGALAVLMLPFRHDFDASRDTGNRFGDHTRSVLAMRERGPIRRSSGGRCIVPASIWNSICSRNLAISVSRHETGDNGNGQSANWLPLRDSICERLEKAKWKVIMSFCPRNRESTA